MVEQTVTRRGFFGHAAGAYALVSGIAVGGISASVIGNLIERHRIADRLWLDAFDNEFLDRRPETIALEAETSANEARALEAILNHRPETMAENAERIDYLYHGPWRATVPPPEQIEMLLRSMTA